MMPSPDIFQIKLITVDETDSTNRYLTSLCAEQQVPELTTVLANYQTAGRGQRGNSWEAERGKNLLFSFVLRPSFLEAKKQFLLSQIVSLAIKEALDTYDEGFSIKWPNDIYWREKKICGILIENDLTGNHMNQTIAGIGLNVNQKQFHSSAPNPVSLQQITGEEHDLQFILSSILKRVSVYETKLRNGDIDMITDHYHSSLFRKEGMHLYADKAGQFSAQIIGVAPEGHLILQDQKGTERKYAFKEVQYLL
ncbi:biotin--[acetyl-CoA-carboxylase] ligase [uncultured Bacteroides sp.]|uniref:biotin--[acetyl-CoA-carboxylase] ligase n=1 Tax=uncultured Bacteroides sp. TaxID=162156 RepID=UPI002AA767A5|nr:biotin--[acetyl-CoA-carboxylase] ligase [uncultured Bacteroides sp.]